MILRSVVPLEDVGDVEKFCRRALRYHLPSTLHIPPDEFEEELGYALDYLYKIHGKWDPSRTAASFATHAHFQLVHYYLHGDMPKRRLRAAQEQAVALR